MKTINKKIRENVAIKKAQYEKKANVTDEVSELIVGARKYHEQKQRVQANHLYPQVLLLQPENIFARSRRHRAKA